MEFSRRNLLKGAAAASALRLAHAARKESAPGLPSQKEIWDWQVWMAKLGPKYTGNPAHRTFVDFLDSHLKSAGLDVARDRFTLPRWEAHRWNISVTPASGAAFHAPVTSYYPYSGQTPAQGVTGELVYAGTAGGSVNFSGLQRKIALVDCTAGPRDYQQWYTPWGLYPANMSLSPVVPHWASFPSISAIDGGPSAFQKAGALGLILVWTDVSDGNAADQYAPFGRAMQNIPALYVGRNTGEKLRSAAARGAKATVVLEASITPDSPTDTLIATLPGTSSDEVIIVNTHTDGPNATEENGGLGVLALVKYFAQIPRSDRKRTIVFVLATGHFAGAYVPSIRGFIKNHPDVMKKAVAALTVEHLGCREWLDDGVKYAPSGETEIALAISPLKSTADIMLEALQGSNAGRTAVVKSASPQGRFYGEGNALSAAGVPTIGYIPLPQYLLAGPANGCIERLDAELMHNQIQVFAKVIRKMDATPAADLKTA